MPTITTVDAAWNPAPATYDDAEVRRFDTAIFLGDGTNNGVRGGVVRHGDNSLAVSVNGSDQVTVQAGAFVIPAATGLGVYRGALSAATSAVALASRNGTNPRIDLIVIQATSTGAVVKTIDGTPSSSPVAPSLPAQHIELARATVPQTGGGAVTVDSSWRSYATGLGGTLFVETSARLPGSGNQKGQRAVALDTGKRHEWTGTNWTSLSPAYAQVTAVQSGIGTITDLTGLSVAVEVGSGRRIRVTALVHVRDGGSGSITNTVFIREGSTSLQNYLVGNLATLEFGSAHFSAILTPSAGPHTYKLSAAAGSNTIQTVPDVTRPDYILVEDIGPA